MLVYRSFEAKCYCVFAGIGVVFALSLHIGISLTGKILVILACPRGCQAGDTGVSDWCGCHIERAVSNGCLSTTAHSILVKS